MIQPDVLNRASQAEAYRLLFHCCGSDRWVQGMIERRPFASAAAVLEAADDAFVDMTAADWREAFRHHPKIGDVDSLRRKFKDTAHLAGAEQSGVNAASEATLKALAAGNRAYEAKFGFIFIVCATGKSADEMLALLQARLPNLPDDELKAAAEEQRKITKLRLEKVK